MNRSGHADLPLHYGKVPPWLATRMAYLGRVIIEALVLEYGRQEVLSRISDPAWFQSLGCVMGMDWHSSGITTSVMGALKRAINPIADDIGLYVCGGRGKHSRQTPDELIKIAEQTGMDGKKLVQCSRLSAKVDNTAIQDGFQIYLHSFVLSKGGEWAVIQQGMNGESGMARRYHWHSPNIVSFTETPHTFIYGQNQGKIINLTAKSAAPTRQSVLEIAQQNPDKSMQEIKKINLPCRHDVRKKDVDLKRLGSILALAYDQGVDDFESLLLLKGVGPRTLQSLTLVSEVIYGTPSRFSDPARFSFAHGGKDGHPFPVPLKTYDETISTLRTAVDKAKLGHYDKQRAVKGLTLAAQRIEQNFTPNTNFEQVIARERENSYKYGGMTVFGKAKPPKNVDVHGQMKLF